MRRRLGILGILVFAVLTPGLRPAEPGTGALTTVGIGAAAFLREHKIGAFTVSHRLAPAWRGLHPYLLLGGTEQGSAYLQTGVCADLASHRGWTLSAGSGPGLYLRNGAADGLGSATEFLSWLGLSRALAAGRSIGLRIGHISNAHLSRTNPGTETLEFTYALRSLR